MKPRIKGKWTFQSTGVLFFISALLELFSINSPVPHFENFRSGISAAAYHLIYIVLFFFLGLGLFKARPWGYKIVFAATGLYTLDRLVYILNRKALEAYFTALLGKYGITVGVTETGFILKVVIFATVLTVVGWWGFAGYAYLRRQYFQQTAADKLQ